MEPFKTDFTQLVSDAGFPISNVGFGQSFQSIANAQDTGQNTDNMVEIGFKDQTIKDECTPGNPNFGKGISANHVPLAKQLKRLEDAITLQELKGNRELLGIRDNQGNFHSLTDDRAGQLAGALHNGWRLIFMPKHYPPPLDANGKLDWSKVTAVEIQEIIDYHKK